MRALSLTETPLYSVCHLYIADGGRRFSETLMNFFETERRHISVIFSIFLFKCLMFWLWGSWCFVCGAVDILIVEQLVFRFGAVDVLIVGQLVF